MRQALCPGGSCGGTVQRSTILLVISSLTLSVIGLSANQLTDAVSDSRLQQSAASAETLREQEAEKRRNSFRSDFGKRLPSVLDGEGELLENLEETQQKIQEEEKEGSVEDLEKRLSRFRSDFGKRRYRADFGKRRYRADFGKRFDNSEREEDEEEEEGKEEGEQDLGGDVDMEKRARFRADLGKRATRTELLGRPGRRFYRADLGKRRYRSDFG